MSTGKPATKCNNANRPVELTYEQVSAWQLLTCGYSSFEVGQMLNVHPSTVRRWKQGIVKEMAGMPSIKAAIDRTMTLVPKALSVVDRAMDGLDLRIPGARAVAYAAAKDVLTANRIFSDRMILTDDRAKTDAALMAEADKIMAEAKAKIRDELGDDIADAISDR